MSQAKSFEISKHKVMEAYKRVRANKGVAGVDKVSIQVFEKRLEDNLYKLWNRMRSGSYFPPPVKLAEIPKRGGGRRPLGIPTVADRVGQMVAKMYLEPEIEPHFHPDSYGYRPKRSAKQAVGVARRRCWEYDWVVDVDIKRFFDDLNHEKLLKLVEKHTELKWIKLYIERWLKAPMEDDEGNVMPRGKGSPQGGVISPLLANLYLHYAFDEWITKKSPNVKFERYADDIVIHCTSEAQARFMMEIVRERLQEWDLEVHPEKTKIVYCKDERRDNDYPDNQFDFLSYTFQARQAKDRNGKMHVNFLPAVSNRSSKRMREIIKSWRLHNWNEMTIAEVAKRINPMVRGWIDYYGGYYRSKLSYTMFCLNTYLVRWVLKKYRRFRREQWQGGYRLLGNIAKKQPELFAHWKANFKPATGQ